MIVDLIKMEEILLNLCCMIFLSVAVITAIFKGWFKEALAILFW
tara:strand:- start:55 stop:186 length:132 start_codon:yes stop_codon:yes gene_type:complete